MSARLFIVDPELGSYHGHHFEYCQSVGEAAVRRGLATTVFAHQSFPVEQDGPVHYRKTFRHKQFDFQPSCWRIDLVRALKDAGCTADDHVFIHTIYAHELDHLHALLVENALSLMPHFHILFRRDLEEYSDQERQLLIRLFRWLNRKPNIASRLHFYTDTDVLQVQYAPYAAEAGKEVIQLPIPQRQELLEKCVKRESPAMLDILYPGDARLEKGYTSLPDAVEEIVKNPSANRRAAFTLHSGYNIPGGEKGIPAAHQRLKALPSVSCPEGPFAPDAYYGYLAKSDIVVLPYNAQRYVRRSSGMLSEAIAAGKVTVVPERTWLSAQISPSRAVTYGSNRLLGTALHQAIENFDALRTGALEYAEKYRAQNTPDALMDALLRESEKPWQPVTCTNPAKKKVLLVCDYWVLFPGNGSGAVGRSQLRWLTEQGFEVHVLAVLDVWNRITPIAANQQMQDVEDFCRTFGITSVGPAWFPSNPPLAQNEATDAENALLARTRYLDASFNADLELRRHYEVEPQFLARINALTFDFVLLDYIHNRPLLEKINVKGIPVICETFDATARQKAMLRGEETTDTEEESAEIENLSRCDGLIFINIEEQHYFSGKFKTEKPSAHLVPVLESKFDPASAAAGCINLAEATLAAGIDIMGSLRNHIKLLEGSLAFDLLMVSSNHKPTVKSLGKFYKKIFLPHLKARGVKLFIAGTLSRPREIPEDEAQIIFLGRAKNLEPLYASAKIILLPIFYGTGTGIKTLEALQTGKALFGAPLAFRGIGLAFQHEAAALSAETPEAFAEKILSLLANPQARKANAEKVAALARLLPSWKEYSAGLSGLVQKIVPGFTAQPPQAMEQILPGFFEPNEMIQGFNVILRMVLMGKEPTPRDCLTLLNAFRDADHAVYQRMFESFFVERTAPLAGIFQESGFFNEAVRWPGKSFEDFIQTLEARQKNAA